jgi:hypothetical protein
MKRLLGDIAFVLNEWMGARSAAYSRVSDISAVGVILTLQVLNFLAAAYLLFGLSGFNSAYGTFKSYRLLLFPLFALYDLAFVRLCRMSISDFAGDKNSDLQVRRFRARLISGGYIVASVVSAIVIVIAARKDFFRIHG